MSGDIDFARTAAGTYVLSAQLWLPREVNEVFAFFADAFNLDVITPPSLRFRVLTAAPIDMREGTLIAYRLKLHGLPLRWLTRISAWDPPHRFVDEQVRGPYRKWVHEHRFEAREGGTLCTDRVEYAMPCGWLVDRLFVRRDLEAIFSYRRRTLAELFRGRPQPAQWTAAKRNC